MEDRRRDSFYGRRVGKGLKPGQAARLEARLPELGLDIARPTPRPLGGLFDPPAERVCLEVGFGGAEHLIHEALAHPGWGFLGVEPFQNGLAKAVTAIDAHAIPNIRLYGEDAGPLLDWLPASSLSRIDLLYPDPWPKRRHWKRRFVNPANLDRIVRALSPGGLLRFASDIPDYVDWTLRHVQSHGGLVWTAATADDWRKPWAGWPGTRYEGKAVREGRRPAYLVFAKPDGAG